MIVISDGKVTLRVFRHEDKFRLVELANNKKISINLRDGFPHPYTIRDAENFIEMCMALNPAQVFAIEYEGSYVGNIGLHQGEDVYKKSAEIGYFIGEPYWNRGITTKAVSLVCEYGFRELDIVRIFTGVFDYNTASQRVLEKCGFLKEAVFKRAIYKHGKIYDEIRYARILNE